MRILFFRSAFGTVLQRGGTALCVLVLRLPTGLQIMAELKDETNVEQGTINPDVEHLLLIGEPLEIYDAFGYSELNRYLEEVAQVSAGFSDEVKRAILERRDAHKPRLILTNDATFQFVDRWDVYDESETPPGSFALLQLRGVMRSQSGLSTPGVDRLVQDLRAAYNNKNVEAVVIETNSGGGESLAGTILKSGIQERNKPVIGFAHLAASAAMRALSGADEIIASGEGSEFGSIGTMFTLDAKFLNKYRARFADFYGATAPKKNSDFRSAIAGDFSTIQQRADEKTAAFQNEIRRERPLKGSEKMIAETLDGSMFAAMESKRRGLIDGIGTMQYAIKRARALKTKY